MVTTEQLQGTVEYVEGSRLVVRMADGEIREFEPGESRTFLIDGQQVKVRDLKPGTKLVATVTMSTTPVTDRTTTVGSGTVWWVAGKSVILTLPNGENRTYKVSDDYRFNVEGNKNATVHDLRKGMKVAAQRIVEEPRVEITSNTTVTGHAPPPPPVVVTQTAPQAPPPRQVAQARPAPVQTPAPAPAPVLLAQAQPPPNLEQLSQLPVTASQIPLIGLIALILTAAGLVLHRMGRARDV